MNTPLSRRIGRRLLPCLALAFAFRTAATLSAVDYTITVNPSVPHQIIDGFGIAITPFSTIYTDSNFRNQSNGATLAPAKTLFDMLFNASNGAGLSIARSEIPCQNADTSEPSKGNYTYNTNFIQSQGWAMQQAQVRGVQRFYALPWSPPGWMKANNDYKGDMNDQYPNLGSSTAYLGTASNNTAHDADFTAYIADYLVNFLTQFNVNIGWVGVNNEMNNLSTSWGTCYYSPTRIAAVLPKLTNALAADYLGTYVTACETSNIEHAPTPPATQNVTTAEDYLTSVFNTSANQSTIQFLTTHYYGSLGDLNCGTDLLESNFNSGIPSSNLWRLWETEICYPPDTDTSWPEAVELASEIQVFMQADYSVWSFWRGASNQGESDGQSLIQVPASGTSFTFTNRLYTVGQFARYIRPGFVRIDSTGDGAPVTVTAYQDPGSGQIVVVVVNTDTVSHTVSLNGLGTPSTTYNVLYSDNAPDKWSTSTATTGSLGNLGSLTVTPVSVTTYVEQITDTGKPAAITTLAASNPNPGSGTVLLKWTAPGGDGHNGTAASYDIRYSTGTLTGGTGGNFLTSPQWQAAPPPLENNTNQQVMIYGLNSSKTYTFAIEATNLAGNTSLISNVTSGISNP